MKWDSAHGYTFAQVWNLIEWGNTLDTRTEFSNELLIGLFWEESAFVNWWQLDNKGNPVYAHAAGFGQIERKTLAIMNALYPEKRRKYTSELIVEDPLVAVEASVDYLRYLRKNFKNSNKESILWKYGGLGNGGITDVKKKVRQWLNCEDILRGAKGEFSVEIIEKALNAAEPNHRDYVDYVTDGGYSSLAGY